MNLGTINRTSARAAGGYYDGTATSTSVAAGSSQTIRFSAGFASTAYTKYWKVYTINVTGGAALTSNAVAASNVSSATLGSDNLVSTEVGIYPTRLLMCCA